MIRTKEDLLNEVCEDGDYHDGLEGWLGYYISEDDVLTVSFEPAVIEDGHGRPGDPIIGQWKLTPIE